MRAINETLGQRDEFLSVLQHNIEIVLNLGNDSTLADIDACLELLQAELLKLATSKSDFEDVAEEIHRLRDEKQKAQLESAGRDEVRKRIMDMKAFLRKQETPVNNTPIRQIIRHEIHRRYVSCHNTHRSVAIAPTLDLSGGAFPDSNLGSYAHP